MNCISLCKGHLYFRIKVWNSQFDVIEWSWEPKLTCEVWALSEKTWVKMKHISKALSVLVLQLIGTIASSSFWTDHLLVILPHIPRFFFSNCCPHPRIFITLCFVGQNAFLKWLTEIRIINLRNRRNQNAY